MISIYAKPGTTAYFAELPLIAGWRINTVRASAEKISLSGSLIRQSAAYAVSSGTATYSGLVPTAQADKVVLINANSSTCTLTDPNGIYTAEINAVVSSWEKCGKKHVEITFKIVSKYA